jgi:uncharacterized damage-inducible protein DinB
MSVFTNPASASVEHARSYTTAVLELLGTSDPMDLLQETEGKLRRALKGLSRSQITEPEAKNKWSVGQVVQHLADSELVCGYRLRMVLAHDRPQLFGYDQDLWSTRLHYDEVDAEQSLKDFAVLRQANLRLLGRASREDLERVGIHAERGAESVAHMVRLYAGHDLLHLRQIERIRRALAERRNS